MTQETSKRKSDQLFNGEIVKTDGKLQKRWWSDILFHAKEYALDNDKATEIIYLKDAVVMYLLFGMKGQPGSRHNREVLTKRILQELGNREKDQCILNNEQLYNLKITLDQMMIKKRQKSLVF
jgi:hypothetical protein